MRPSLCQAFILAVGFLLSGCSIHSAYNGGRGNFSDYEGYKQWRNQDEAASDSITPSSGDDVNRFDGGNIPADLFAKDSSMMLGMRETEAIQRATMRSYKVGGKWYHPSRVDVGDIFDGIASWYGPNFHDKKTSNGETYNMHAHTAASKTLPMNTIVKVTNKENNKITIVRINDRGPFVDGRIIDLSNVAARDIAMVDKGTAKVRLEVIGFGGVVAKNYESNLKSVTKSDKKLDKEFKVGDSVESVEGGGFALQVGAFRNKSGADETRARFAKEVGENYQAVVRENSGINRVFITGFRSEDEALDLSKKMQIKNPIIIRE